MVKTTRFLIELEVVLDFIARDNLFQALAFSEKLDKMIYQPHLIMEIHGR